MVCCVMLAGCVGTAAGTPAATPEATVSGDVVVFAAASLTDAFGELAAAFAEQHPEAEVIPNFAGSQQLAGQIVGGAAADVFASADQRQMEVVGDAGLLGGEPQVFAANLLEIAVEPGNPLGLAGLADLANPDLAVVLAAPEVPAGHYTQEVLTAAGLAITPASLEVDVRAVLSRVALGEADAGIVYRTDIVAAGGKVDGVEIPPGQNAPAAYPIAALANAPNARGAQAFLTFVLSAEGRAILDRHGFLEPA
jgi:molybdate transport system substrate-binding protein